MVPHVEKLCNVIDTAELDFAVSLTPLIQISRGPSAILELQKFKI